MTDRRPTWCLRVMAAFSAVLALAWLLPNHYPPWTAFHSEWLAGVALAVAVLGLLAAGDRAQSVPLTAILVALVASIPMLQLIAGQIYFAGDAFVASLYLTGLSLAIYAGFNAQRMAPRAAEPLAWAFLLAALASVALACVQWLNLGNTGLFVMELAPGGRPYANLAQPNQLATLLVMGGVCALLLYHWHRLGAVVLCSILAMLLAGVALTQSRAAWAELVVVLALVVAIRKRARLRVSTGAVAATAVTFAIMAICLNPIAELLLLGSSARDLTGQLAPGTRLIHWETTIDAICRQPWFGYGWNQVSVAVAGVAADHRWSGELVEHSHNLVLDLLAWNGVPIGLAIVVGLATLLWLYARMADEPTSALLVAAVVVPFVHAMVEFPLHYAYFLLPVGYMLGMLEARHPVARALPMPRKGLAAAALVALATLIWLGDEYLQLEENNRSLRFETARIGSAATHAGVPHPLLLTQLGAFLTFARTEAKPHMSAEQLEWMREVAARYGYAPVLFRYAVASGLNRQPDSARVALQRICRQHPQPMCKDAKENWSLLQNGAFPELRSIPFPD